MSKMTGFVVYLYVNVVIRNEEITNFLHVVPCNLYTYTNNKEAKFLDPQFFWSVFPLTTGQMIDTEYDFKTYWDILLLSEV